MVWPVIAPQNVQELPIFYLFWILTYLAVNIIWDIRSGRTPPFHVSHLSGKTTVAFNAASFTSSLLIVVGLFDKETMKVAGDTMLPLVLAGLSGVFLSLSEICPYKPEKFGPPTPTAR